MPYRLILHLPDGPRRIPLPEGSHVLGSEAACDIRIRHMTVSRRHARLDVSDETLWIEDLGSSNGTSVESRRIQQRTRLEVPSRLGFGAVRAELESLAAGDLVSAIRVSPMPGAPMPGAPMPGAPLPGAPLPGAPMPGAPLTGATLTGATLSPAEPGLAEPLSDTSGRTLSSSSLEELTLRRLPSLVEDLASGTSPIEAAQRVGADLFHSLPCYELEIWCEAEKGKAVWFSARTEILPAERSGEILAQAGDLHIRAGFVQRRLAQQLAPLIRVGLHLVRWTTRRPPTAPPERRPDNDTPRPTPLPPPATVDPQMLALYTQAERVARSEIGILIYGESGTGKEVTARFIHRASGKENAPFVAINCAALPRDLLEVELFGIERAVATGVDARPGKFELAHGGTLFLDEIGDMALETQAKILRVLQEGELFRIGGREPRPARPRILAATHRDVEAMIREGSFRRDLYYRLAGWVVQLPALRDRLMDLPNLAARFLAEEAVSLGRDLPGITLSAMDALMAYDWPGNIRELRHEISRAALFLNHGEPLDSTLLSPGLQLTTPSSADTSLKERLEQFERSEILRAIERSDGDIPQAAAELGVGRSTLYRRMKALGLQSDSGDTG